MSIYLSHLKNWCVDQSKNCLQGIAHSKTVQAHAEKISFATGYVWMEMSQYFLGKKQLNIPHIVRDAVIYGKNENVDALIGLGTAPLTDQIATPIFNYLEPLQKQMRSTQEQDLLRRELVAKYGFPKEILEARFTKFATFILESELYLPIHALKHRVIYSREQEDLLLLVDLTYVPSKEILETFQLEPRPASERMFLPPYIVDKKSNARYAYLTSGLTAHDVDTEIRPYQILPIEERPEKPTVKFCFFIDAKLESPEDAAEFLYHAWCEVIKPRGECYSFGLFGQGIPQCPDPSSYLKKGIRSVSFLITEEEVVKIFKKIDQLRREVKGKYHLTKYNCAALVKEIASVIGIHVSGKDKLKLFDTPITRIKMFAISSILSHLLRHPDVISKIGVVQEGAAFLHQLDTLAVNVKDWIEKVPVQKVFDTDAVSSLFKDYPQIQANLLALSSTWQREISHLDVKEFSKLYGMDLITAKETYNLCHSMLTGSVTELTYKIYNLFDQIFLNYYNYEISSPGFLFTQLEQERKKRKPIKEKLFPITIM